MTEATHGVIGQSLDFNYQMGLGHENEIKPPRHLPGKVGPYYSEQGQRNYYNYWAGLMGLTPSRKPERAAGKAAARDANSKTNGRAKGRAVVVPPRKGKAAKAKSGLRL